MDFSSAPKFMLIFNYPDLTDIKVNDNLLKILLKCNFSFRVKILPLALIFSMLEASLIWQRISPFCVLKL